LFQPFFTTKPHGTGLGLFVSRKILEDFSGTLDYRSEPGQGATFIVRLPLQRSTRSVGLIEDLGEQRQGHSFDLVDAGLHECGPRQPVPVVTATTGEEQTR
jgi:hypothetical protein